VRRIFAQISVTLPEKTPKKTTSKKKLLHFFSCWRIFVNQSTRQASFLPKFIQTWADFPQLGRKEQNKNMISKKKK